MRHAVDATRNGRRATTWVAVDAMGPWGWRAALENNVMRCVSAVSQLQNTDIDEQT